MKSAIMVLKEQIDNFYLIRRLSLYELKSQNKNNYLGILWEIINPTIQILIYWFVFGTLRSSEPINVNGEYVPFFIWLLIAFILWIFFYQSTIEGSKSIYSRLLMLSKMNFPMSVIPNYVIFSKLYVHIAMLIITIIFLQFYGFTISIYSLQIFYYLFATLCLIFSVSLITSTLSTIIRDVHMFLNSTLRMGLYLSGVLWPIAIIGNSTVIAILKLNPLYYLIEGYRHALLGSSWYLIDHWQYTLYFWGLILVLFLFGSILHIKFRRHFIDYL
ncbi:ABC transporter permease [Virgibacillus sp. LDC-1]|uniref:ABC transporter permease n=1 Tax=Virgibacillus sp. LDC-1 TaxID=3039856 RepID=UPI0024DE5467|nr:ABC transporter permease [Virgibacillus sp. LDC-1]